MIFFNKKSFLTEHQTQQPDLMFLFRLKMDRRSKTVQHERIKQKTVLVLISALQETDLSGGHRATQGSKVKCLFKTQQGPELKFYFNTRN